MNEKNSVTREDIYNAIQDAIYRDVIAWHPQAIDSIGNATDAVMDLLKED